MTFQLTSAFVCATLIAESQENMKKIWLLLIPNKQQKGDEFEEICNTLDLYFNPIFSFQSVMEYEEHEKRAWSVDFSRTEPSMLVSGSDDCKVLVTHESLVFLHLKTASSSQQQYILTGIASKK